MSDVPPCCSVSRGDAVPLPAPVTTAPLAVAAADAAGSDRLARAVRIPGGTFLMGSQDRDVNPGDGEGPVRPVTVSPYLVDATAVTNEEFAAFINATGYVTDAERFGWSFVFASFLPRQLRGGQRAQAAPWWVATPGATWRAPEGPGSDVAERGQHPVVHVSHADASEFAQWCGMRLPTEAEWERAARGGLEGARYAWGEELTPDGVWPVNIWQGRFPTTNTAEDGYVGTAPVRSFPANGFGLYEVSGNVWEWVADRWSTTHPTGSVTDPTGPATGEERVMRGGSYLCHDSYCNRYRVAARTKNTPDSSAGNIGFRCAADLPSEA